MNGPTYFGGNFNAWNFAYGVNPLVAALSVHNVPVESGARALTVAFGYASTWDGIKFYPLSTNAPVSVGSDSNAEEVTPSAVSNDADGYGAMNFTATFTKAHAEGDPVASATLGLQEAIDFAESQGGGNVIVDETWAANGGTTDMINAAVIASPATVTIVDNRG